VHWKFNGVFREWKLEAAAKVDELVFGG